MTLFKELGMSEDLLSSIESLGFTEPTQIQEQSIPFILEGNDVLGESATGSGKTLAFGCGVIENATKGAGLQSLILTPTRELAEQIKDAIKQLAHAKRLRIITVYGGVSIGQQIEDLHHADVVVATPGRLLDHLDRGTIDLSKVTTLVLDEADRMLDMGFIDDVEDIISCCPKERQTLFFSATLSPQIKTLASRYMVNPMKVSAKKHVDPSKLQQIYYDVTRNTKLSLLVHLLKEEQEQGSKGLAMVFCNTRRTTDFVINNLKANKIKCIGIHGGFSQNKRIKTIKMFTDARFGVLVCTDVVARGLHVDNVSHVYNYEIPKDHRDYVHRIGRTARAGEEGMVVNLLAHADHDNFGRVLHEYRDFVIPRVDTPELARIKIVSGETRRPMGRRGMHHGGHGGRHGGSRHGRGGPRHGGRGGSRHGGSRGPSRGPPRRP